MSVIVVVYACACNHTRLQSSTSRKGQEFTAIKSLGRGIKAAIPIPTSTSQRPSKINRIQKVKHIEGTLHR